VNVRDNEARALALLGDKPLVTLIDPNDPGTCLSVRLWRTRDAWCGVVDDGAALLDRVRMGLRPAFLVHHEGATPTISGELELRILGPVSALSGESLTLADHPFGLARGVLVELVPQRLALEPIVEGQTMGAVPRT
jgi:hypothetical protein